MVIFSIFAYWRVLSIQLIIILHVFMTREDSQFRKWLPLRKIADILNMTAQPQGPFGLS